MGRCQDLHQNLLARYVHSELRILTLFLDTIAEFGLFLWSQISKYIHTCVRDVKFCIVLCARDSRIVKFLFFITLSSSFDYLENRMARVSDMCSV